MAHSFRQTPLFPIPILKYDSILGFFGIKKNILLIFYVYVIQSGFATIFYRKIIIWLKNLSKMPEINRQE